MLKHSSSSSGSNLLRLSCLLAAAAAFSGCALDSTFIDNYEDVIGADGKACKDIQYIEVDDVRIECKTEDGAVCTKDDIEVTQKGEIIDASKYERYYISFSSDRCPSRIDCKQKGGQNYCGGSTQCDPGEHFDDGACVPDSVDACGSTNSCTEQVPHWVSGECFNGSCRVDECERGFKPSADQKSCASDCRPGQHYDNAAQGCVEDDLENCGSTGNRCDRGIGWDSGTCTLGKCNAETCETGYDRVLAETVINEEDGEAVEIFACRKGDCPPGQHSDKGICIDDTIGDCGQAGYKCAENVTEWAGGRCENGICIVESCSTGFKPSVDAKSCASDCNVGAPGEVGQHYDSAQQKCVDDDLDNCGQKGLVCASTAGWVSGQCLNNKCVAEKCDASNGYTVVDGKCVAACIGNQVKCGGLCRDPMQDSEYCGATGTIDSCTNSGKKCASGQVCVNGNCEQNTCGSNEMLCSTSSGKECINVNSNNADNCGSCGFVCTEHAIPNATSSVCAGGACQYECSTGYVNVGTGKTSNTIVCINPKTDSNYCGATSPTARGKKCDDGEVCVDGSCAKNSCTNKAETLCSTTSGNTCINIKSDNADNCGACGYKCSEHAIQNATSNVCNTGNCEYTCATGYVNVGSGQTSATIKCVDPKTDNQFCGATSATAKGKVCPTGQVCVDGNCAQNSCTNSSETLCSTTSGNTCINIKATDANNCGACGYKCSEHAIQNATSTTCSSGECSYTCTTGYVNVGTGSTAATIKCVDPKTDNQFCGATSATAKGKVCPTGQVCVDGSCAQNSCTNSSETLCSTSSGNTCINIKSNNADNCGACGYKCSEHAIQNATSTTCNAGNCEYTCATGYVNVGTGSTSATIKCVDPKTDNQFCGATSATAKGQVCSTGKVCVDGSCATNSCTNSSETLCSTSSGNTCINIKSNNADNCGACGYKCSDHAIQNATSTTCNAGNCQYSCATGYVNVGTGSTSATIKCVDPKTDNQFCGATSATAKGQVCSTGKVCVDGSCAQNSCTNKSETLCSTTSGNTCINIKSDNADNCGACGYKCSEHAIQNATSTACSNGECSYTCATGYVNVGTGSTSATIKCVDPKTDNQFCGATSATAKGQVCSTGRVCVDGSCAQNSCDKNSGETLCSTTSGNKCINLKSTDANNCGACGYKCSEHAIQNATSTTCNAGNCQYTCATGYVNVGTGSTSATIKCVDPKTDNQFCGATSATSKGKVCTTGTVCIDGSCAQNSCTNSSETLCSTTSGNTCINIKSDNANNCGACGYRCSEHAIQNATSSTCSSGNCQYTCATGYVNVGSGKTSATIKCVDPKTDNNYCGATSSTSKGQVCSTGKVCIDGSCATNSCTNSSETLCSTTSGNTCINIKSNNADNCGACGYKCSEHAIQNATSTTCSSGNCSYTCATGYVNVGTGSTSSTIKCINPNTDNQFCGATSATSKGKVCTTGTVCIDGSCVQNSCTNSSETLCSTSSGNTCINIKSNNADNCGACGYKCSEHAIQNATSTTCSSGNCSYTCANGYVNVGTGSTSSTIKCIDPKTDNQFCGATSATDKGEVCSTGKVCVKGSCVQNSCMNIGETLCSTSSGNTCINIKSTNASNCGACGYKCSEHAIQNATSNSCSAGNCQYTCATGYVNVGSGKTSNTIKCIDPKSDNNYCGATSASSKGKQCSSGQYCVNGTCQGACTVSGYTLCGNQCINMKTDLNHCGACENTCKIDHMSSALCVNSRCEVTCEKGFYYDESINKCISFKQCEDGYYSETDHLCYPFFNCYKADMVVSSKTNANANVKCILGNLTVSDDVSVLALKELEYIGGALVIKDRKNLMVVDLPKLAYVSYIDINNTGIYSLDLPSLRYMDDKYMSYISIINNSILTSVKFENLVRMEYAGMDVGEFCDSTINFRNNPKLTSVSIPKLVADINDVYIMDNTSLETVLLNSLSMIQYSLWLERNNIKTLKIDSLEFCDNIRLIEDSNLTCPMAVEIYKHCSAGGTYGVDVKIDNINGINKYGANCGL